MPEFAVLPRRLHWRNPRLGRGTDYYPPRRENPNLRRKKSLRVFLSLRRERNGHEWLVKAKRRETMILCGQPPSTFAKRWPRFLKRRWIVNRSKIFWPRRNLGRGRAKVWPALWDSHDRDGADSRRSE